MIQGGEHMGRGKYQKWRTPEGREQLRAWAAAGLTDAQIAARCGVGRQTLYVWLRQYPDIADSLTAGRQTADEAVEGALYRRALGYNVTETRTERGEDGGITRTVEYQRHVPGAVAAQTYWLSRRCPERWGAGNQPDQSDVVTGVVELPSVSPDNETIEPA